MRGGPARIAALLRGGGRFLLTGHVNPDGDSIASACALRLALAEIGSGADIVMSHPVPRVYRFLAGADRIVTKRPRPWRSYAALVVLDCGDARRASGLAEPRPPVTLVNIDHHATNPGYGDLAWVDPAASSTAEVVTALLGRLGVRPAGPMAEALYTGLLTDTGSFRHSNVTPRALRTAARLVAAGADPARVARQVYESNEFATVRALGETLTTMQRTADGTVVWIALPRRRLGALATPAETEEWAAWPRSVAGARVALCFKETAPGEVRLSFRSTDGIDVAALAARWGGGGHRAAAGATAHGPLARVVAEVVDAAHRLARRRPTPHQARRAAPPRTARRPAARR